MLSRKECKSPSQPFWTACFISTSHPPFLLMGRISFDGWSVIHDRPTVFPCQEVLRSKGEAPDAPHPTVSRMNADPIPKPFRHMPPTAPVTSDLYRGHPCLPSPPLSCHSIPGCVLSSGKDLERYLLPFSHLPSLGEEKPPTCGPTLLDSGDTTFH